MWLTQVAPIFTYTKLLDSSKRKRATGKDMEAHHVDVDNAKPKRVEISVIYSCELLVEFLNAVPWTGPAPGTEGTSLKLNQPTSVHSFPYDPRG